MARITRVAKAQQSKRERVCRRCRHVVQMGESYAHQSIKTGPRSSSTRYWCFQCMTSIKPSEAESNPRRASLLAITESAEAAILKTAFDEDAFENLASILRDTAEGVRDVAGELTSGADNIEEGFGHETEQSQNMREQGEALEEWAGSMDDKAEEIEADKPEPAGDDECDNCGHERQQHSDDGFCMYDEDDDECDCSDFVDDIAGKAEEAVNDAIDSLNEGDF